MNGLPLHAEIAYRIHITDRARQLGIPERELAYRVALDAAMATALAPVIDLNQPTNPELTNHEPPPIPRRPVRRPRPRSGRMRHYR